MAIILKNKWACIITLILVFCITECIINPIGNFPLNDDWVYARASEYYSLHHNFNNDLWGCATMFAHTLNAQAYISCFGFSHTVLRFSTITLSLITVIFFFLLLVDGFEVKIKNAFYATLLFLFNPLFLSLTNSYMTDVPFLCFVIIGVYAYFKFYKSQHKAWLVLSIMAFVWSMLIRQLGLAFVIGAFLSDVYVSKKIKKTSLVFLILCVSSLFIFEHWFSNNIQHFGYTPVFQRTLNSFDVLFFKNTLINFSKRWIHYTTFTGLVLSPILIPYLIEKVKTKALFQNIKIIIVSVVLLLPVLYSLRNFPLGNYLYNIGIGPQTLYDTYILNINQTHSQSFVWFYVLLGLTVVGSYALLFLITDCVVQFKTLSFSFIEKLIFFSVVFYYSFLAIPSAIFDRYIFIVTLCIIPIIIKQIHFSYTKTAVLLFLFITLFSVFATKDYLQSNRTQWKAISFLQNNLHVKNSNINSSYEFAGISDVKHYFTKWNNHEPSNYLITYGSVNSYKTVYSFSYQRYIPYKTDTLFVLQHY